ncbi:MAG: ribosome biogenesis GTPase Der [Gammaproteobacteria bacterium]|nr:MAG: ribosome biogenesis GTPase Der [Gammaproteobacteria bacterium]RTZ67345.1 MAG: ribosome biogenesis GTPase Der [Aquificaceae bacterium]
MGENTVNAGKVVIVGRPNVGKSTLFNKLVGKRKSVVEDKPGVTRDKVEDFAKWQNKIFRLVDTGGLMPHARDFFLPKVREQIEKELPSADAILFVVDAREGLTSLDEEIAQMLLPYRDKVFVVINKVDSKEAKRNVYDFYVFPFRGYYPVSSIHGHGLAELLDDLTEFIKTDEKQKEEILKEELKDIPKIAIIGRPNVGKSSLFNQIVGEERTIVSPIAGTTVDAVDTLVERNGKKYLFIDTAGVRRPSNVEYGVEFFAVNRTLNAIERSDICILVIDGQEGVTHQDQRLAGLTFRRGKGLVIDINKADLMPVSPDEAERQVRRRLFFVDYAPVVFTIATEGDGIDNLFSAIDLVWEDYNRKHKTSYVNNCIRKIIRTNPPPSYRGKPTKIYYAFQKKTRPPTVVVITNRTESWKEHYKKFFIRRLRECLNIHYAPLVLEIAEREED